MSASTKPEKLTPAPSAALEALWAMRPKGPWVLTSLVPDGGKSYTATFRPGQEVALAAWVEERNGVAEDNVYFMVNLPRGDLTSKAKKENVAAADWLHVDIDPGKDETSEQLEARVLPLLEAYKPRPSVVIHSGGGLQAFWRLSEPVILSGPESWEAFEAFNIQLATNLGGDNCHNVDRIMRLPGTVNWPNKKKREKGRVPRVAALLWAEASEHPLAAFTAAPRVQSSRGPGGATAPKISGNLSRVALEQLPESVTARIRRVIVDGDDPDDTNRYSSRSEAVFGVTCALIRAGCPDDVIASILTDPDYGISAHVRDQPRSVQYAAQQIQNAREEVEEPMLRKLNGLHAVIEDLGGKCRIISEVFDPVLRRARISKQSFEDFRNRYMNVRVQVGEAKGKPVYALAGTWWLQHPLRRQFTTMVFAPGQEVPEAYNLWRGFACDAVPGTAHEPLLEHIRENICSGVQAHYDYLIRWMARAVQRPGEQGEVAVVMRSGEGAGKGTFASSFGSLWGRHFMHVSNAKHLVGQFNTHLRDCVFLHADEAFFAGDKQHESVLKTLITEDTLVVEGKGVDAEVGPNFVHLIMSGNGQWLVPAGADARRFFVLDVGEDRKQNSSYFANIRRAMAAGGREALLYHLLSFDLSGFDVRSVPQTEALSEQKVLTMAAEEQWWLERLMDGRLPSTAPGWDTEVPKDRMHGDYLAYCERQRIFRRLSPTALGKFLDRVLGKGFPQSTQRTADVEKDTGYGPPEVVRERTYFYTVPDLDACRLEWVRRYGAFVWPREEAAQEEPQRRDPY